MRVSQAGTFIFLFCFSTIAFQNCAPANGDAARGTDIIQTKDLTQMQDDLKTLATKDLSCSTDSDCQLVDVGAAPCGGPDYHLAVSKHNPQLQSVLSLAQEYSYQDKIQSRPDLVGICMVRVGEHATCLANSCTVVEDSFQ